MSSFLDVLQNRTATQHYDSGSAISDETLRSILEDCTQAPSSFNLQHWRFLAITASELKERLLATTLPSNRQRVFEAPLSVLIVGDTQAHLNLARVLDDCVEAETLTREVANEWLGFATKTYSEIPTLAREEAIRSCSLAAMSLMLSASNRGYSTCPIGFNAPDLIKVLSLPERYVPVIWITLGQAAISDHGRRPRRPVSELLSMNTSPIV